MKYSKDLYKIQKQQQKQVIDLLKNRRKVIKTRINDCYDKKMYVLAFITAILGGSLMGVGHVKIDTPISKFCTITGLLLFPLSILDALLGKRIEKGSDLEDLKKTKKELELLIEQEKVKYNEIRKRRVLKK